MTIMKLTERERTIIATCGLLGGSTLNELSKASGYRAHEVRYSISRLRECGAIRRAWIVDIFRLGYYRYNVFFSMRLASAKAKAAALKALAESPKTAYLSEVGGEFDFELAVVAKEPRTFAEFMRKMSAEHGDVFYSKAFSTRLSLTLFPRKYLSSRKSPVAEMALGQASETSTIDELDHQILQNLSASPDISRREIAQKLGRAESTVELRFQRLCKEKIISGAVFSTLPAAFGSQALSILIYAHGIHPKLRADLAAFAKSHSNITYFIEGLGDWDYEFGLEVEDHEQIVSLREEIYQHFGPNLVRVQVLTRLTVHKYSSYPLDLFTK